MSNFCSACGAPLNPDSRFCPSCGSPVTPGVAVQAGPAKVRKVHKNRRRAGFIVLAVLLAILVALLGTGIGLVATAERYYVEEVLTYNNYVGEEQEFKTRYNENGDVLLQTSYLNEEPVVTEYSYGSNGMIESMTQRWSDGDTDTLHFVSSNRRAVAQDSDVYIEYVYDRLNRCIEQTSGGGGTFDGEEPDTRVTMEYHGLSRTVKRSTTDRWGVTDVYEYNEDGQPTHFICCDEDGQVHSEMVYTYAGEGIGQRDARIYDTQTTKNYNSDSDTGELVLTDSERVVLDRVEGNVRYYTAYDEVEETYSTYEVTCNANGDPTLLEFTDEGVCTRRIEYNYNEAGYLTQRCDYNGDGELVYSTTYSYQKRSLKGMFRAVLDKFK